jgi:hypothetical protein
VHGDKYQPNDFDPYNMRGKMQSLIFKYCGNFTSIQIKISALKKLLVMCGLPVHAMMLTMQATCISLLHLSAMQSIQQKLRSIRGERDTSTWILARCCAGVVLCPLEALSAARG